MCVLVAELDDKIAGYGHWRKALKTQERSSLSIGATDPEFRGRGLRTALTLEDIPIARGFGQFSSGQYTSAIIQPSTRFTNSVGESPAQDIAFISGSNPDDEMKRARLTRGSNAT